jgi:hypothetical protein
MVQILASDLPNDQDSEFKMQTAGRCENRRVRFTQ